tara:strand:- start:551 stop:679 length:129 start_codon:yes stop_codon:yes gene_type:complete
MNQSNAIFCCIIEMGIDELMIQNIELYKKPFLKFEMRWVNKA